MPSKTTYPGEHLEAHHDDSRFDADRLLAEAEALVDGHPVAEVNDADTRDLGADAIELASAARRAMGIPGLEATLATVEEILSGSRARRGQFEQEVGQADRARARTFPLVEEIDKVVGLDAEALDKALAKLKTQTGSVALPQNKARPAYAGGATLPPLLCAYLMMRFKKGMVWEYGPAVIPASASVARHLGRHAALMAMPTPAQDDAVSRLVLDTNGIRVQTDERLDTRPGLVIVPLPLPVDVWSIRQHLRLLRLAPERYWAVETTASGIADFGSLEASHPEFALGIGVYLAAVEQRLRILATQAGPEAIIAIVAPDRHGLPGAVQGVARHQLRWQVVERFWGYEAGGCRHRGDGSPFGGWAVSVWRAR